MKLLLAFAPLVIASTAYAQAPGDYYGDGYGDGDYGSQAPGMTPYAAPTPPPPPPPQRIRRFSIGLGVGHANLAPHTAPDNQTDFAVGQLSLRYLLGRHFELELALSGGGEQLDDGSAGNRELSSAVLGVRWRFSPQRRWNWWLMAGMGSLAVTQKDASSDVKDAATQSTLQFGVGLERRWSRFALQAELRAVGVAKNEDDAPKAYPVMTDVPTNTMNPQPLPPPPTTTAVDTGGKKGGQFAISANYYF